MKKSKIRLLKPFGAILFAFVFATLIPMTASAHCDTMDGPTVADGLKAMDSNNVNYVLKWVQPDYEAAITDVFNLSMKVKDLGPEAKEMAEKYFFSELVRMHRAGEGAPFDGLKPSGTPIDERVLAADESIASGSLAPLEGLIEEELLPELTERFDKVMALKDFDVNDVEAGREYIEAYVSFFKFAEGEEEHHGAADEHSGIEADSHAETAAEKTGDLHTKADSAEDLPKTGEAGYTLWLPWSLAAIFFTSTILIGVKARSKHCHK
jgi:hypothetical protein